MSVKQINSHIEFVDPVVDALKSQEYEIQFNTIVFESGGRREDVTTIDEQKVYQCNYEGSP